MTTTLDVQDEAAPALPRFVTFRDLQRSGITDNWTSLDRLVSQQGFPSGRMISANRRVWTVDEVNDWVASRPTARRTLTGAAAKRHAARISSTKESVAA